MKPKHSATPPPCKFMHQNFALYSEMRENLISDFDRKEVTELRIYVWASQQSECWRKADALKWNVFTFIRLFDTKVLCVTCSLTSQHSFFRN